MLGIVGWNIERVLLLYRDRKALNWFNFMGSHKTYRMLCEYLWTTICIQHHNETKSGYESGELPLTHSNAWRLWVQDSIQDIDWELPIAQQSVVFHF